MSAQVKDAANIGRFEFVRLVSGMPAANFMAGPFFALLTHVPEHGKSKRQGADRWRRRGPELDHVYSLMDDEGAHLVGLGVDTDALLAAMSARRYGCLGAHRDSSQFIGVPRCTGLRAGLRAKPFGEFDVAEYRPLGGGRRRIIADAPLLHGTIAGKPETMSVTFARAFLRRSGGSSNRAQLTRAACGLGSGSGLGSEKKRYADRGTARDLPIVRDCACRPIESVAQVDRLA